MSAHARNTDPITSHEAAASVQNLSGTKQVILRLLSRPMTDEQLWAEYDDLVEYGQAPRASVSGVRSRRHELFTEGLVCPVGFELTASKRKALVWVAA